MAEYINREEAIETLQRHGVATDFGTYLLERLPAIDPVHAAGGCYCEQCQHFARRPVVNYYTRLCDLTKLVVYESDFCSRGTRMEEAQNSGKENP